MHGDIWYCGFFAVNLSFQLIYRAPPATATASFTFFPGVNEKVDEAGCSYNGCCSYY